jgi:glutamate formiminotransferase
MRSMHWAADGLALGDSAPALPFGGSESSGVAIEVGTPTVIAKARLVGGLTQSQMRSIAAAAGGSESGLTEVRAYPIAVARDGAAIFVLELSDVKRAPLHRALTLLDIEARRFGARLGLGSLLSNAPLELFLDALAMHMGLDVARRQVIETHLPTGAASP